MRRPGRGVVRLGGGNAYVFNKTPEKCVEGAAAMRPHAWVWSEGAGIFKHANRLDGYDTLLPQNFGDMKAARDNLIMVRDRLDAVHQSVTKACDEVEGSKVAKARHFQMYAFAAPFLRPRDVVCVVGVHPNWVGETRTGGSARIKQLVRSMHVLDSMLAFSAESGWLTTVIGDFNIRQQHAETVDFLNIYSLFDKYGLNVKAEGLDGIAWDKRLILKKWHAVGARQFGSDHDHWTVADFRRR